MDWQHLAVAADRTHHVLPDGTPAYPERYAEVLKFHAPGLAPATDALGASHIDPTGRPAYPTRFQRTFGFYEGRAAVDAADGWYHISPDGRPLYDDRHAWCGNYQGRRCAVRFTDGGYGHLLPDGTPAYAARWRYAGDYRDGFAVVQRHDGLHTHIDIDGNPVHGRWFVDLDVFHKEYARARDEVGWTHVDVRGRAVSERRFVAVEPFYNGQARVERRDGGLEVIDETAHTIVELRPGRETPLQRLSGQMVGYWSTQTIHAAVELGIFDALPADSSTLARATALDEDVAHRLVRALWELGLVDREAGTWVPTETGQLLCRRNDTGMPEASIHWATEHYRAWPHLATTLRTGRSGFDTEFGTPLFDWLAQRPAELARYQRAMRAYALHDYADLPLSLPLDGVETVIDAGGGQATLLTQLLDARPNLRGRLLDLGAVVSSIQASPSVRERLDVVSCDISQPWPCTADLVVMARVLHDWSDAAAARILSHARSALHPDGRIALVEWILSDDHPGGSLLDLNMAVACGSRERSLEAWRALAANAGLRIRSTTPLLRYGHVIELVP